MLTRSNDLLGQKLGTCTLQRLIGRGGMGAVYLAQQSRPRRIVAVKVLLPGPIEQRPREEFLARFRREADAIAALDHIHIMPIYEYGELEDTAYLVMPYVTGGTLRDRLLQHGPPPLVDAVSIIEQAAAGLDCAHRQGIIHRDLKPANILFHADGRTLLADFGLAKMLHDEEPESANEHSMITSSGMIVGTSEYLSPEQGIGNPVDYRTDVYSLGVVLYQMLVGRVPFTGPSPVAIAIKHALDTPPPISTFNSSISPRVEAVVMKALAKAPEDRFSSAGELAHALRAAITEEQQGAPWHMPKSQVASMPAAPAPEAADVDDKRTATESEPTRIEKKVDLPAAHSEAMQEEYTTQESQQEEVLSASLPQGKDSVSTVAANPQSAPAEVVSVASDAEEGKQNSPAIIAATASLPENSTTIAADTSEEAPDVHIVEEALARRPVPSAHLVSQSHMMGKKPSLWVTVLSTALGLLLIGAGIITYLSHNSSPAKTAGTQTKKAVIALSPVASKQPVQQQQPEQTKEAQSPVVVPLPTPAIPVGTKIYATAAPSSCDQEKGHWSSISSMQPTCDANGATFTNTVGHATSSFLEQMPDASWPTSYVIQTQVTVHSSSYGRFGVSFRQANAGTPGGFAFLLDPQSRQWKFAYYDDFANQLTRIIAYGSSIVDFTENITLDIQVAGTSFVFYANGVNVGHATVGGQYTGETVGVITDSGADVSFKNLVIYAPA